jgi:hypothetical protein
MKALSKVQYERQPETITDEEEKHDRAPSDLGTGDCNVNIHIKHVDAINIYNCSPSSIAKQPDKAQAPETDYTDCIPFVEGHKPKQDYHTRINPLLKNNKVPSVLAATFFHQARRFLQGFEPANDLEEGTFAIFEDLPASTREILECVLDKYDTDRRKSGLFSPEIDQLGTDPLTVEQLASYLARELVQRASVYYFDDPNCFDSERPGLLRQAPSGGGDDVGSPLIINISEVNGLRTNAYLPALSLGEYRTEEIQQVCTPEIQGESFVLNCEQQTDDCVGNSIEGVCLRVPEVMPGDAVLLQGFNYFSVDGRVRLTAQAPSTVMREVDALVCGDITTGLTETVDGVEHLILDSRVKDQILFTVPADLPEGVYGMTVIMPLNGAEIISSPQQFIRVLPPPSTTFQIASEELKAIDETSPSWPGSDEVGIKTFTTAITLDGELGPLSSNSFKFGDVDSGETRDMSRVLFQQDNIAGVVITIIGHEIDNDNLYEQEVDGLWDAFVELVTSSWNALVASPLGGLGGTGIVLATGISGGWAPVIGGAITLSINGLAAFFGRADLIIEDTIALNALDLAARTSVNFPAPEPISYTTPGEIDVTTEAISKDVQYKEKREYESDNEGSKYHITLRYNRL